jgi:hypothetical protein
LSWATKTRVMAGDICTPTVTFGFAPDDPEQPPQPTAQNSKVQETTQRPSKRALCCAGGTDFDLFTFPLLYGNRIQLTSGVGGRYSWDTDNTSDPGQAFFEGPLNAAFQG